MLCALFQVMQRLQSFFSSLGVDYVLDTTFSRDISLLEMCDEFVSRFRSQQQQQPQQPLPLLTSACPGWVCYAEKKHGSYILPYISSVRSPQQTMGVLVKQFLAARHGVKYDCTSVYGLCVGFPRCLLLYISRVPIQVFLCAYHSLLRRPESVYHASCMPCFDKKLEASRPDFTDTVTGARDVVTYSVFLLFLCVHRGRMLT